MKEQREAAEVLARFAGSVKYTDLPFEVIEATKRSILDNIAITITGSTLGSGHEELVSLIEEGGGKKESTILGFGFKVPAWMAALGNGAMARAVNYDDNHDESSTHTSGSVVPAALAVAERVGKVCGKDLITAVTVGNEVACRMGLSIFKRPQGRNMKTWFLTSIFGAFGSTLACGKILGLDANGMQNALGIALFQASGTMEAFNSSGQTSMMRGMLTGFAAKSAVLSALMAEKGIAGVTESLDGESGLYSVYFEGDYNKESLLSELGKNWLSAEIALKPWPTCRYTHPYIDATLQLVRSHNITNEDVREIRVFVAGYIKTKCEPLEKQRHPLNFNHAGHALPYLVAAAVVKRRILMEDLTSDLRNMKTLEVAQRVVPKFDERFEINSRIGPARVEIDVNNGRTYSKQVEIAYGHPRNPITPQDLINKFRDCVSYSKKPINKTSVEEGIRMLNNLENIDDVRNVIQVLS